MADDTQDDEAPRKPEGKAIEWSAAQIDALAEITPDDLDDAEAFWRANASKDYRGLIDASSDDKPAE
jgi:hypothetical protein